MNPRDLLALSDERDTHLAARHYAWHDGYTAGYQEGYSAGYLQAIAEIKAVNASLVDALAIEGIRWGPGGRSHFADPRPGDYPGQEPR